MNLDDIVAKAMSSRIAASIIPAGITAYIVQSIPGTDWSNEADAGGKIVSGMLAILLERVLLENAARIREAARAGVTPSRLADTIASRSRASITEEDIRRVGQYIREILNKDGSPELELALRRAEEKPSLMNYHNAFEKLLKNGRIDEAFEFYDKITDVPAYHHGLYPKPSFITKLSFIMSLGYHLRTLKNEDLKNEASAERYVRATMLSSLDLGLAGEEEMGREILEKAISKFNNDAYLSLVLARYEKKHGFEAEKSYEKAANLILKNYKTSRIGESKNPVFKLDDYSWLGKLLIMKTGEKEKLEVEAKNALRLRDILKKELGEEYQSPTPLAVVRNTSKPDLPDHIYLMEREDGKTLLEVMLSDKQKGMDYLDSASKITALYHARTDPESEFVTEKLKLYEALHRRLGIAIPENHLEVQEIIDAFKPIIRRITGSDWVANKDAHPENFLITEDGSVVVIDTEASYLVPQFIDAANLLAYSGTLTLDEQLENAERYLKHYSEFSGRHPYRSSDEVAKKYFDSVLYRTYTNYGFFSTRPSKRGIAANWLRAALEITELLADSGREYPILNRATKKLYERETGS